MHYMIEIDESKAEELSQLLATSFPDTATPLAYAVNEDGNGTPMHVVDRYYTSIVTPEYRDIPLLPWEHLPERVRMEFGANLASTAGWLCPGLTFDCEISAQLVSQLAGKDAHSDDEDISLPSI